MWGSQYRGHGVDLFPKTSQGTGQETLALRDRSNYCVETESEEKSTRGVGLRPELLTAGRHAAPSRSGPQGQDHHLSSALTTRTLSVPSPRKAAPFLME